jgi:hypothetical protein
MFKYFKNIKYGNFYLKPELSIFFHLPLKFFSENNVETLNFKKTITTLNSVGKEAKKDFLFNAFGLFDPKLPDFYDPIIKRVITSSSIQKHIRYEFKSYLPEMSLLQKTKFFYILYNNGYYPNFMLEIEIKNFADLISSEKELSHIELEMISDILFMYKNNYTTWNKQKPIVENLIQTVINHFDKFEIIWNVNEKLFDKVIRLFFSFTHVDRINIDFRSEVFLNFYQKYF